MKILEENIGFIGCGNMGFDILSALLSKTIQDSDGSQRKVVNPNQIFVFDPLKEKTKDLTSVGVHVCTSNKEVVDSSQIIILAVKPQDLISVAKEIHPFLKNHVVISILAGTPISKLKELLGGQVVIVRAMPNIGVRVKKSATVLTSDSSDALEKAEWIFGCCGSTWVLDEKYFDVVTVVSGSGPAYFFFLMELLSNFAREAGISEKVANELTIKTAECAADLAQKSGDLSLTDLRKQVTSKGGTTEAAFSVFSDAKVADIVADIFERALKEAVTRAQEISNS